MTAGHRPPEEVQTMKTWMRRGLTLAVLLLAVPGVARAAETAVKTIAAGCGLCPPGGC
jgi:hypothetical protein